VQKDNYRKTLGNMGEKEAIKLLEQKGIKIITKNYRIRSEGEIDIIAQDNNDIVFIEVKVRSSNLMGCPEESIDERKQNRIRRIAEIYLARNNLSNHPVRFDVIIFYKREKNDSWNAKWIKKAF
jgi:putative endonuclease